MDDDLQWELERPLREFHQAARNGEIEIVRNSIEMGLDVNALDPEGSGLRPLFSAAQSGYDVIVEILLLHGADVSLTTGDMFPLHGAAKSRNPRCVELLLAAGSGIDATTPEGHTPLHYVTMCKDARSRTPEADRCAQLLIAAGANVEAISDGFPLGCLGYKQKAAGTPLSLAVHYDHRQLVKVLLKGGASAKLSERDRSSVLRNTNSSASMLYLLDAVAAAGSWELYESEHRHILSSLVTKCAGRPFPLDAAGDVVDFLCPYGGYFPNP